MSDLDAVDAVILAGGLGTRIRGVLGDLPKVLAPINHRPFLDHLLDQLAGLGVGRAILALGVGADRVLAHLAGTRPPLPVVSVVESAPLGTAGALRLAAAITTSDPVLVLNGDTWLDADFAGFLAAHRAAAARPGGCLGSLLCVEVEDVSRYGRIEANAQGDITRFVEKDPAAHGPGLINGGALLLSRAGLATLAAATGPSLERDFLSILPPGRLLAHRAIGARFIDIGTPDSLARAGTVLPGDLA